jgi:leader peptidase (prepilin peptidase)/N-methyltransferase
MMLCMFFAIGGLLLGSFLNVCIVRLPLGESIARPRSHCRHCSQPIANRDNVPVLSWLLLRGACRTCGGRISWRYPAVELTTCALFVLCCLRFSSPWPAAAWAVLCFLLLGLAVMDAETLLLPDAFTLPGLALGILLAGLRAALAQSTWAHNSGVWGSILRAMGRSLLAAGAAAATLLLITGLYWLARRRTGMGLGDVKLLAMLAAWLGLQQTALTLFLAVIGGALYGVALILWSRRRPQEEGEHLPLGQVPVPFGTMLCLAGLYCIFLGERTLGWYLQFFS